VSRTLDCETVVHPITNTASMRHPQSKLDSAVFTLELGCRSSLVISCAGIVLAMHVAAVVALHALVCRFTLTRMHCLAVVALC
jgi:hypothetical protein